MALNIVRLALRDTWEELWTILIVNLLFLLGIVLILPAPPATLALFFYANRIAHGEVATEREFLGALRRYWRPAWRWGLLNILVIGLLSGDYYLIGKLISTPVATSFVQGLYLTLLAGWSVLQLFALPFFFEQEQPSVAQALGNATRFIRKNLLLTLILTLLLGLILIAGTLAFMLTLAFGGAFIGFASNHAVLQELSDR